jgi:monofunctional biosynthetic peptidoglycan transglycosylase
MRKLRELIIARRLEAALSKRRILELYLNVVEWGDGIYGAEAASRTYFRKPASALSPSEAALLAGALVNARVLVPSHANTRLLRRQRIILARMGSVTPPAPAAHRPDEPLSAVPTLERMDEPHAQEPAVVPATSEDSATAPPR